MNKITALTRHFYGSASKEFLAANCPIGDFMQPIYGEEKRRIIRKLGKLMML
jgi:hypothetical protein